MSVFCMAHNLTIGRETKKDCIQPFTVMAEEHPPSPEHGDESLTFGRLRVKPAMTVSRGSLIVLKTLKTTEYDNR